MIKLYWVVPDFRNGGEEWGTFAMAATPSRAILHVYRANVDEGGLPKIKRTARQTNIADGAWTAYDLGRPDRWQAGAVKWAKIPRSDWVLK